MARKHLEEEEKKENGERWLLTYSDLITLLLALFIIMYGMSSENSAEVRNLSEALSQAFNGKETQAPLQPGSPAANMTEGAVNADPVQSIYNQLSGYIADKGLEDEVDMVKSDHSISIRLRDSLLFRGNSATLNPGSEHTLETVSDIIQQVYNKVDHVTITGNTADLGNRDAANEADSWQLSVDRAVKVLTVLTSDGLGPEKMSIEGNSHYKPISPNDTPEGRAANRRVEIMITDSYQ